MKIEITKIEKTSLVFEKIKNLYAEISKVETLEMFASSNDFKGYIQLTLTDPKSIMDYIEDDDITINVDRILPPNGWMSQMERSRLPSGLTPSYIIDSMRSKKPKKDKKNTISNELSETATMQILGIILCEKQKELKVLFDELEEIGVSYSK